MLTGKRSIHKHELYLSLIPPPPTSSHLSHLSLLDPAHTPCTMDEGTIKTPIPKCRLYWCFCLRWCSNFVGSESGHKKSVKLLQNIVYNTTQHPHPPTATNCLFILYVYFGKGGRGGRGQRGGRGATVHKGGRKYQHDWLYLQSINSTKHQ